LLDDPVIIGIRPIQAAGQEFVPSSAAAIKNRKQGGIARRQ
jgi:hypothetical protein